MTLCLQLLSKTLTCIDDLGSLGIYLFTNPHYFNGSHDLMLFDDLYNPLEPMQSIDHLCINPFLRIGLIHK